MPPHDSVRLHQDQRRAPVPPEASQSDPKQSVSRLEVQACGGAFQRRELLPQCQVLQDQFPMSAERQRHRAADQDDQLQHVSIVAGVTAKINAAEFWRRSGNVCGQDDRSSSAHACCKRRQAWNRLGDNRRNRRSALNGTNSRVRSTGRRILILARPSGRRSYVNLNPELRSRARASRRNAVSFFTRRRSSRTSCRSSDAFKSVTSRLTNDLRCRGEPPTRRRARDPEIRGDGHVPGTLDEIPKPVVVVPAEGAPWSSWG
jgi:hypothetical protein